MVNPPFSAIRKKKKESQNLGRIFFLMQQNLNTENVSLKKHIKNKAKTNKINSACTENMAQTCSQFIHML